MAQTATVKIVLDTRRIKDSGLYPVKVRVTFQRVQKYYPVTIKDKEESDVPFDLSADDFDRVYGSKPRGDFKKHRDYLDAIHAKFIAARDAITFFSFDQFEAKLFGPKQNITSADLREAYNAKIKELLSADRLSSAIGYELSRNSILGFRDKLTFFDISPDFLRRYKIHMEKSSKSAATIGIYLRYLRGLFNEAIRAGVISREIYPFSKDKNGFQIPTKRNPAAPLRQTEISAIYQYTPENDSEAKARDLWLFTFLLNGANMRDVSLLKFRNIDFHAGRIVFYRSKSSKTARDQKPIEVALTPLIRAIIDRWGNEPGSPERFVFPIFEEGMTIKQQYRANENARKTIRKYMVRIAEKLGIPKTNIHNYTARDSFAAAQRNAGESGDIIGEALGHENRHTTDAYLDRFGEETKRRISDNALRFLGADE